MADVRVLQCQLFNFPICTGLLRWMGIQRQTAESVIVNFEIRSVANNKSVFKAVAHINTHAGKQVQRATLPASVHPATFGVVVANRESGDVWAGQDSMTLNPTLKPGLYRVLLELSHSNILSITKQRDFVVQPESPFVYWVNVE